MKKTILFTFLFFTIIGCSYAQQDLLYKKDTTQQRCKILKTTKSKYRYAFLDSLQKVYKASISKSLVDSVKYNYYDSNLVQDKLFKNLVKPVVEANAPKQCSWIFTTTLGFNLGNLLEFNNPSGIDKKTLSGTATIDLGLNYAKEGTRFAMTNELHSIIAIQKSGLTRTDYIQRASNDISTLHDFSFGFGKSKKWNFNLIAKTNTSLFTVFDGDYYKDYNALGKTQAFLSPYDVTISPGIKWQPNQFLRLSISPYSFNIFGIKSNEITAKGIYITDVDASGNYKNFLFKRLGAEMNFWYDRNIKKWIEIQYRIGVSSNYFEKIANNGLLDGLFITKFKLLKDLYLTHRASLKMDFSAAPIKPFYSQTLLLSFTKSF